MMHFNYLVFNSLVFQKCSEAEYPFCSIPDGNGYFTIESMYLESSGLPVVKEKEVIYLRDLVHDQTKFINDTIYTVPKFVQYST